MQKERMGERGRQMMNVMYAGCGSSGNQSRRCDSRVTTRSARCSEHSKKALSPMCPAVIVMTVAALTGIIEGS